ncbi:MAG: hypothetical protein AUK56_03310 [Thiomicrospira sp. CG2_30_44_34]|nr:MAG: hypothetical protein AUK56_03310 [Thiomicrospira sp. CG2_30_44_34]
MQHPELKAAIQNRYNESYFYEVNRLTFEKASSEDVLAPHYQTLVKEEEALFVVVGTDSGLLYQYIKAHIEHKHCQFVFIDFDDVIDATGLADESGEIWQGQVRLVNQDFNFMRLTADFNSYIMRRRIHLIKSLAVMDAQPGSAYAELWNKIEVGFVNYCRSEFNVQSNKVFEEQRLLNAADNWLPAVEIDKCLEGREAIILGGGPTLDDAIDWVRDHQDKLIIFAAARIAKRLEREGILVDFFVTVDPFPWNFDNSKAVLGASDYSILAHSFHAQHRLLSQWNGLAIYMGQKYAWYDETAKANIDTLGPTVTNSALHLACTLGATRVFFAGVDFCFAQGKTHESGSDDAKHADTVSHYGKARLLDNAGQMTETGDDFYSAKQAMENMIRYYLSHKPIEFISLGLHSAQMEHVTYQDCQDVVLQSESKQMLMTEIKLNITLTPQEKYALVQQTQKELKKQHRRFQKLHKLTKETRLLAGKLYDANGQPIENNTVKLKKYRKKIDYLVGRDGDMLASYQAAFFADVFKPIENEAEMTQEEVVQQLQAFFGGVEKVSGHLDSLLKQGLDRAQLRLDELDTQSLPSHCIDRWRQWDEFGRALQWQSWHPVVLNETESHILQDAIDRFQSEYEKTDHLYTQMLQKNVSNVSALLARANNAFALKNHKDIADLIDHVETLDSAEAAQKQDFLMLLKGMLHELQDEAVEAFNVYETIASPALKHIALKKMLPIAMTLKDFDAALIVLERLCQISLEYMVSYADLLGLLGNKKAAIEVLMMYLGQFPDRPSVKNKLAQYYIDEGQLDEAKAQLEAVLAKDENNRTAQHLMNLVAEA